MRWGINLKHNLKSKIFVGFATNVRKKDQENRRIVRKMSMKFVKYNIFMRVCKCWKSIQQTGLIMVQLTQLSFKHISYICSSKNCRFQACDFLLNWTSNNVSCDLCIKSCETSKTLTISSNANIIPSRREKL